MELEPPPAKKLRGENGGGGGGGGENADTLSNSNGANGSDKSLSVLNGETKMSKTAVKEVGLEGDKKKIAPVKSSSGGALKSDSKMIIKGNGWIVVVEAHACGIGVYGMTGQPRVLFPLPLLLLQKIS